MVTRRSFLTQTAAAGLIAGSEKFAATSAGHESTYRATFESGLYKALRFLRWGNRSEALKAFQKALVFSPKYLPALKGEVELLYEAQDNRVIACLGQLLKVDPHDQTAHEMLAVLEAKKGNCQNAVNHFVSSTKAIANHPGSLELYGYCLRQTRQPQEAIPVFEQLVALLPQEDYPKYNLAVLQVETNQNKEALENLEPLLSSPLRDPDVLSLASQAYEAIHDTPKATTQLRQAIVANPVNPNYYTAFSLLCLDHMSYQVGIDMLDFGLRQIPDNSSLYVYMCLGECSMSSLVTTRRPKPISSWLRV